MNFSMYEDLKIMFIYEWIQFTIFLFNKLKAYHNWFFSFSIISSLMNNLIWIFNLNWKYKIKFFSSYVSILDNGFFNLLYNGFVKKNVNVVDLKWSWISVMISFFCMSNKTQWNFSFCRCWCCNYAWNIYTNFNIMFFWKDIIGIDFAL